MAHNHEIIDLGSSSDEELLPDMTSAPVHPETSKACVTIDPEVAYCLCLHEVVEVFPDISLTHVRQLYDSHTRSEASSLPDGISSAQLLIEQILDAGKYPKERDPQREASQLKRKRESHSGGDDETRRWINEDLRSKVQNYVGIS